MKTPSILLLPLLALALPAQQHFQPAPGHLLSVRISDFATLNAAAEQTVIARILALPEVAPAIAKATERYQVLERAIEQLGKLAEDSGAPVDMADRVMAMTRKLESGDVRDLRLWLWVSDDGNPTMVLTATSGSDEAKVLADMWTTARKQLVDHEGYVLAATPPELGGSAVELLQPRNARGEPEASLWYWHQDGRHVLGAGDHRLLGTLGNEAPARTRGDTLLLGEHGGIVATLDLPAVLAQVQKETRRRRTPEVVEAERKMWAALGITGIRSLSLAITMDAGWIRESLHVEMPEAPTGLLAAWTGAKAALPAHPQVEDPMLQAGFALDLGRFEASLTELERLAEPARSPADQEPSALRKLVPDVVKALTGGASLQVSAPARGSLVPRLSLALGIADRATLDALLARARTELQGITFDDRETQGVPWTSVKIPNSPSAMVPTFAVLDDVLVLTESPATLRAMIKARADGGATAMSTAGAPPATPVGEPAPALDLRYDVGAMWRVLQDRYLPMVQLMMNQAMMMGGVGGEPLLETGELPDGAAIAPHLGLGRGGLSVADGGLVLSTASALGDPLLAAMTSVMAPMVPTMVGLGMETGRRTLQGQIGEARLKQVHQAIATWRTTFGGGKNLPRDLGELFARGLLADDDGLLVPGDEKPLTIEIEDEDGDIRKLRSSFRYVADGRLKTTKGALRRHRVFEASGNPFLFEVFESRDDKPEEVVILLYEANEHPRRQRLLLTADGEVHRIGEDGAGEILGGR